jgi:hypothetical protein
VQLKGDSEEDGPASMQQIKKYKLLPFMHYFSQVVSNDLEIKELHINICKYFLIQMKNFYMRIDVEKERHNWADLRINIVYNETNIWAALDRIKDFNEHR